MIGTRAVYYSYNRIWDQNVGRGVLSSFGLATQVEMRREAGFGNVWNGVLALPTQSATPCSVHAL